MIVMFSQRPKIQALPKEPIKYEFHINGFPSHTEEHFSLSDLVTSVRRTISQGEVSHISVRHNRNPVYEYKGSGQRMDFVDRCIGITRDWK